MESQRCENRRRVRVNGNRGSVSQCSNNGRHTIWRMREVEGEVQVETMTVCGTCRTMRTTGSQREPMNPWQRRRGE